MPEEEGAPPISPTADAVAAPSAVPEVVSDQQPSGTAPPPPSQAEERKPWNFPPEERWEELRQQRDAALARERQAYEWLQRSQQPVAPQPAAQPVDFWEGRINHPDPQTAQYWQGQKQMADHVAQQTRQQVMQELQPIIHATTNELARINTKEFRRENPDVKVGSEDERLIIAYMEGRVDGVRHPMESAKRNAMHERLEAENRALKSKQTATPRKAAAAATESTSGIPATAGLPPKPGDWREKAGAVIDQGGNMKDVANAIFK